MSALQTTARVAWHAALVGFRDERTIFTWKTWTTGWMLRVIAQVVFFALIGLLVGSLEMLHFILVGNAVLLATMSVNMTTATTTWERRAGTMPLLVAAPGSHVTVFLARSFQRVADGSATAVAGFFVAAWIFALPLPWPAVLWVVPLMFVVALTSYLFALFLGALVLRAMDARNVVSNIFTLVMMAVCGVNVPVDVLPGWAQVLAVAFPLTHGLEAVRELLAGASARDVIAPVGLALAVGLAWLTVAIPTFWWFAERGRRDGTIEFGG